ncbi:hypothetical protein NE237_017185 [Protea cynaroides]|uniref:Uncharacterized protein n=1 Tax=Protea cynaroides TaxID=273540 RepID=A0A9Q0K7J8_9MAGN|nr:hypothetical protein NE237_017185 [Protea cynaroides]
MSKGKGRSQSKISRYAGAPVRLLCRARDLYVQSITSCAGNMSYGGGITDTSIGLPASTVSTLPKSFSVSSSRSSISNEDLRDLMRVASKRTLEDNFGTASPLQQTMAKGTGLMMPRSVSQTVAIARIDEDKPCDFTEDNNTLNTSDFLYPRSRSCAVVTNKRSPLSRSQY